MGVPVSIAAFVFLALLHELTHLVWEVLLAAWGFTDRPLVVGPALAAVAGLPLGVVVGPEAPLLAIGAALALVPVRRRARSWPACWSRCWC